jgi:hypothetical protein
MDSRRVVKELGREVREKDEEEGLVDEVGTEGKRKSEEVITSSSSSDRWRAL